jgi:uncharacterized protein
MEERDDDAHRVVVKAQGMEQKGRGAATALVTARAEAADGGTMVKFRQDLTISGAVAQFSRGMMQDVSGRMTKQFADCVQANLSQEEALEAAAKPPGGIRLALWALWRAIVRFFKRLFAGGRAGSS